MKKQKKERKRFYPKIYLLAGSFSLFILLITGQLSYSQKKRPIQPTINWEVRLGFQGDTNQYISKGVLPLLVGPACVGWEVKQNMECPCMVSSYTLLILRNDSVFYKENCQGYLYTKKTKIAFKTIQKGDVIIIYKIKIKSHNLGDLEFESVPIIKTVR